MAGGISTIGTSLGGIRPLSSAQPGARALGAAQPRVRPAALWIFIPPSAGLGAEELWMIGGEYPLEPGQSIFIGSSYDVRLGAVAPPVPPGTVASMRWQAVDDAGDPVGPGDGETYTFTLYRNGAPTLCQVVLTGDGEQNSRGKSNVAVSCNDMDRLGVLVVASAGARRASVSGTIRFAPDPDND